MSNNTPPTTAGGGGTGNPGSPSSNTDQRVDSRSSSSSSTRYADIHPADTTPAGHKSGFTHEDDEQVTQLARQMSHRYSMSSQHSGADVEAGRAPSLSRAQTGRSVNSIATVNPFFGDKEELNPDSEKFNARSWVKNLVRVTPKIEGLDHSARTAGVAFTNLSVHGFGSATDYQKDVGNIWFQVTGALRGLVGAKRQQKIQILRNFDGLVKSGEMLVVLGRPGSGCSTLLKTIAGETHGFYVDEKAQLNYQGIPNDVMHKNFRGEVIYQAETDVHFPQLTVGQTLDFAARARTPRNRIEGVTREQYADHMRAVFMAMFGLSHTVNTPVGNDFIRGVSGGERKRVSIAEVVLAGAPLQCWDNSTRGLDSATAVEFVKSLRMGTEIQGNAALLAIYQAPQAAYDYFDKVVVLYEGRQIFFGPTTEAKQYFLDMGFICRDRSTIPDFLTSLTSPAERIVAPGFENRVPRTADEFAERWANSDARKKLLQEIDEFNKEFPLGGQQVERFTEHRQAQKAKSQRAASPYTISLPMQIALCMRRGKQRLRNDFTLMISAAIGNFCLALIIGSVFYNLPHDTSSFFSRGALLFFAILMNAFASALEILTLYAQRPIVEKHAQYSFYHPFAEAVSSMLVDLPAKILTSVSFNLTLYFMTNLRREVGPFFIFLLFSFFCTLVMSNIFRTIAAFSRTLYQAMPPAAIFILALVTYTGFAIPTRDMRVYMRWINYVNPIAYAFESLMVNEFSGQEYPCVAYVPNILGGQKYANLAPEQQVCTTVGSVPGRVSVSGDAFIEAAYNYQRSHLWRNIGILAAFFVAFLFTYLAGTEYISAAKSKGEVLVFRKGKVPESIAAADVENPNTKSAGVITPKSEKSTIANIQKQTAIFHWEDVCYDVQIKDETRRILDHVDGWVKPGTLTALMGVSGAGKTTLLDVLANRVTMGVVDGGMFVDGHQRDDSFQRKTGYVQQQDLHLSTTTVREALQFSAVLRQPAHISLEEKLAYADEVIELLEMSEYADAVVGVPGEGLNVEQRKRLTIGVELAAKPELLLFLDEPTSGLDSQTAWSICTLMRKLANNGQAILCTIHQPSAILFQEFDRLLFLAKGGKTVYFGPIGTNSHTLTSYFERNGSHPCPPDANPAEWMLEVIGAAPGAQTDKDWFDIWTNSPEKAAVKAELAEMSRELSKKPREENQKSGSGEFAVPFVQQVLAVTMRVFQQYWRTPTYIYSKFFLCVASGLFIGFSFFMASNTQQGLQNQMFAIFMLLTIFGNLAQQMMPHFVTQRALYEVRERPSKAYSWKAFMIANIFVEIPWQTLMAVLTFVSWYYPIGLYRNAEPTGAVNERAGLMFLLIWAFYLWISTFSHLLIAGIEIAENGGNIGNLLFSLALIFCGVLAPPGTFPQFWIFLYRVSPFTYLVSAMLSTGVANTDVTCSSIELLHFDPPSNETCGEFMADYMKSTGGGKVFNPLATSDCQYCPISRTNQFLGAVGISYDDRWRNFGLMMVYIVFNIFGALAMYWLVRMPKKTKKKVKKE